MELMGTMQPVNVNISPANNHVLHLPIIITFLITCGYMKCLIRR